jgi:hypothetical protein
MPVLSATIATSHHKPQWFSLQSRDIEQICPMGTAANVMFIIAGGLMMAEGALKFDKPDTRIMRMGLPCGGG